MMKSDSTSPSFRLTMKFGYPRNYIGIVLGSDKC